MDRGLSVRFLDFMSSRASAVPSSLTHTQGHCFSQSRSLYNRALERPAFEDPAREHFEKIVVALPVEASPSHLHWRCNWCERDLWLPLGEQGQQDPQFDAQLARRHLAECSELRELDPPTASFFRGEVESLAFASALALPSTLGGVFFLDRHVYNNLHSSKRKHVHAPVTGVPRRSGAVHIAPGTAKAICVETSDILFQREEERKFQEEVRKEAERRRAENQAKAEARRNAWRKAAKKVGMLASIKKKTHARNR